MQAAGAVLGTAGGLGTIGFLTGPAAKNDFKVMRDAERDQGKSSEVARLQAKRRVQAQLQAAAAASGADVGSASTLAAFEHNERVARIDQFNEDFARKVRLSRAKARAKNAVTSQAFGVGLGGGATGVGSLGGS